MFEESLVEYGRVQNQCHRVNGGCEWEAESDFGRLQQRMLHCGEHPQKWQSSRADSTSFGGVEGM